MTQVCLMGVGLIGGSLGQALRRLKTNKKRSFHVFGLGRSSARLRLAKSKGAIDAYASHPSIHIPQSDVVVLCMPIQHMAAALKKILPYLKKGAVVTDVGSVKKTVLKSLTPLLRKRKDVSFVGGHPIAGSERSGVQFARPDLFQKSVCVLAKDQTRSLARRKVALIWKKVGANVLLMSADKHDQLLALTSHLPHLLAFSLFSTAQALSRSNRLVFQVAGRSFRDMTRVAASDANLWKGIFDHNQKSLKNVVGSFLRELKRLSSASGKARQSLLKTICQAKKQH